jgi:hypothetical protein
LFDYCHSSEHHYSILAAAVQRWRAHLQAEEELVGKGGPGSGLMPAEQDYCAHWIHCTNYLVRELGVELELEVQHCFGGLGWQEPLRLMGPKWLWRELEARVQPVALRMFAEDRPADFLEV